MSGSYAGSGMTWRGDEGRFYLMDQGYSGAGRVWKLDPSDPPGTIESVPWTFANLGDTTTDISWGIAWDSDSGCFWISQIPDGNISGGCYLMRHVWNGSRWVWGGTPSDSWCITDTTGGMRMLWVAGMEKWHKRGYFVGGPVSTGSDTLGIYFFDPYNKTVVGGLLAAEDRQRGLTLVPWDSCYILTCGWNLNQYRKLDSLGRMIQSAPATHGPSDWSLYVPSLLRPEDTVCAYSITSHSSNYFQRVSTGMLWRQLGKSGVGEQFSVPADIAPRTTFVRGQLSLPCRQGAALLDIAGRKVMSLHPGENDVSRLAPGVYFVRRDAEAAAVQKVIIQR